MVQQQRSTETKGDIGRSYVASREMPPFTSVEQKKKPFRSKIYRNSSHLPLGYQEPMNQRNQDDKTASYTSFGQMLHDMYGITRQQWVRQQWITESVLNSPPVIEPKSTDLQETEFNCSVLGSVPSGGGCFPCELYIVLGEGQVFPAGVYHYDPIHHSLDIIRQGNYLSTLQNNLTSHSESPTSWSLIFSCCFWKDAFRYGKFSYRLQSLDLGVVIMQCLEVAQDREMQGTLHYQFVDTELNDLLGLDIAYESVYAVVTLHSPLSSAIQQEEKAEKWSPIEVASSIGISTQPIDTWPSVAALHMASLIQGRQDFLSPNKMSVIKGPSGQHQLVQGRGIQNSYASISERHLLLAGLKKRHSAKHCFKPGALSYEQFAGLLSACSWAYTSDVDGATQTLQHTLVYFFVHNVATMQSGIYCYIPTEQALVLIQTDDADAHLALSLAALSYHTPSYTSLYAFPVGDYEEGFRVYGDRWYRMQNIEAGMVIQRLYLAAAMLGLGCQASLGYSTISVDRLLKLPENLTALAEVLIAPEANQGQYYELPISPYFVERGTGL